MEDLPEVLRVYEAARAFMRTSGNPDQWGETYPPLSLVEQDILAGDSYLVLKEDRVVGTFVFFCRPEPDYEPLKSGAWLKNGEYGVIHRVASDGTAKGVFSALFEFARGRVSDLRIDTHADNRVMQAVLLHHGFIKRGVAVVRGGGERLAFEYNGKK